MRGKPDQSEPHLLTFSNRERSCDVGVTDVEISGRMHVERFWTGQCDRSSTHRIDEGNASSVVKPWVHLHLHRHAPAQSFDDSNDLGKSIPGRHAINDANFAIRRLELRFKHQGTWPIEALSRSSVFRRSNAPSSVMLVTQECCKAGGRVE